MSWCNTHIFSYWVVTDIWTAHSVLFKHGCGALWGKDSPTRHSVMSVYVMSGPGFPVCAYVVYLSTVCVRECASAAANLPACPHTCFLTPRASTCGHQSEALWSRSHCFLYDCLRGVFPLRIDFIMSVILSLTLGALYVCHFFIMIPLWPALALSVRAVVSLLKNFSQWRLFFFFREISLLTVCSDINNI